MFCFDPELWFMVAESSHWYFRVVIFNSRRVYTSVQTTFPPEIVCLNHSPHFSPFNETRQTRQTIVIFFCVGAKFSKQYPIPEGRKRSKDFPPTKNAR